MVRNAPSLLLFSLASLCWPCLCQGHEGPDPVAHWYFSEKTVGEKAVSGRLGPDAKLIGRPVLVNDSLGSAMRFDGSDDALLVDEEIDGAPTTYITIATWASIEERKIDGVIVGNNEGDGEAERGWSIGYDERSFCFTLSTHGADDGNGESTTLVGTTPYELGKLYHLVGVYDGAVMRLYVNGKLEAESTAQKGPIYWPRRSPLLIGGDSDYDEPRFHRGVIRDVAIYNLAAQSKWVAHEFEHGSELTTLNAPVMEETVGFVIRPYLQYATTDSITIMCETTKPARMTVYYGGLSEPEKSAQGSEQQTIHEVKLTGLAPQAGHYYRVELQTPEGEKLSAAQSTFQTASLPETPYSFGVIGDTQGNPKVSHKLVDQLWQQRPNFLVIPGDLTDTGPNKSHWTEHFFVGMQPLAARVPFYPVLGNHEQNAKHYYNYMALPDPEYYYSFRYGNGEFFMIDSNQRVDQQSEQYQWLEKSLAASKATWKFVSYHHPSYSSDEDDYGDLWRGEKSTWGDTRIRPLVALYDKYGVDVVWNGHIHSYERTWPMKEERVLERGGTTYIVTGGGGGGLETPGPIKPWFQSVVDHGHHYCLVAVNGGRLEFKAFDLEGRLFDVTTIEKRD